MKRNWETDEFREEFALLSEEGRLWHGKTETGQLGLAIALKFFQREGRFPNYFSEVPEVVVNFIACQLGIGAERYEDYVHQGSVAKRDRATVRAYLGVRESTREDLKAISDWISTHPDRQQEVDETYWSELVHEYLRQQHIECPTLKVLRRAVRSGLSQSENRWYEQAYNRLSEAVRERLEGLLKVDSEQGSEENSWSRFAKLKNDPSGLDLNAILSVGQKLHWLRSLQLPQDLFAEVGIKYLETYSQRAALDAPSEMQRHAPAVHYTLLATFCWQRQIEMIDQLVELLIQIIHKIGVRADYKSAFGKEEWVTRSRLGSTNRR